MEPQWSHSQQATGTTAQTDEGLRSYMLRVYNYMGLGVALTGIVTLLMANSPSMLQTLALGPGKWVVFALLLGMGWFSSRILTMQNTGLAQLYYWSYAALWGVLISPMIVAFLTIEGGVMDIARAFLITAGMFLGTSIYGHTTKKNLSGMGQFVVMAIIGLLIAGIVQMIFFEASSTFSLLFSVLAVGLFAAMTAYETQMIRNMYLQNAKAGGEAVTRMAVFGALMIYGNFVIMFIHVLNILASMRE